MRATTSDKMSIRFATVGEGKPLVLLHGFTDSIESWWEMGYVDPLVARGHKLILIDQRGHGGSDKPHGSAAYADDLRAGDVAAVLDALAISRASVFGYSMGGWAALNVARYHPDRVGQLIVGGCHPFGQSMAFYRDMVASGIDRWLAAVKKLGGPMTDGLEARIRANDIAALRAAVSEDRPDISAHLARFERPCLFFAGSDDPLRVDVARCAEVLPRAKFHELPGCNHLTALLRADLVMPQLLAFLSAAE